MASNRRLSFLSRAILEFGFREGWLRDSRLSEVSVNTWFNFCFGADQIMSIYVGNLSYTATQEDLEAVFAEYGSVKQVYLPVDRETGRKRGFGFVEMSTDAEEDAAIADLDGAEWMGRQLKVNKARPREAMGGGNNRYSRNR